MTEHHLKIPPEHFSSVHAGIKRAELRKDDRGYKQGDILNVCEWDRDNFTGRFAIRQVSHVADVSAYLPGYVLLSMEDASPADEDLMWRGNHGLRGPLKTLPAPPSQPHLIYTTSQQYETLAKGEVK